MLEMLVVVGAAVVVAVAACGLGAAMARLFPPAHRWSDDDHVVWPESPVGRDVEVIARRQRLKKLQRRSRGRA